jgi:hypothetical protein
MIVAMSGSARAEETPAAAPPAEATPGPPSRGLAPFRLQMDVRVGLGGVGVANGYDSLIVSGATVPFGLSAGVSLTRALVVFGEISDNHMVRFTSSTSYDSTWFDQYGAGLRLKYYVTPGFFVSGSGSLVRLRIQHQASDAENSQWGPMAGLSAGGEWPVSSKWSVGLGAEYVYGVVHSRGLAPGLNDPLESKSSLAGLSLLVLASYHQPAATAAEASGSPEVASAPATPPAGAHTHDGLYLNASLGPGWLRAKSHLAVASYDTAWSGRATSLGLSAGYAFAKRFVVFAAFSESQVRNPSGDDDVVSVEWTGLGPGLRYYLMPANVFFSGSFLLSKLAWYPAFSTRGSSNWTSDWGGTGQIAAGKEWWVLGDLGVGVAAVFAYGKVPATNGWLASTFQDLSLAASVSFN